MDINMTLLGQMITFGIFVWVTMKFVWPPVTQAMSERQKRIADGLEAAERGQRELELAKQNSAKQLRETKLKAAEIVEQANRRGSHIIEESKVQAKEEGERLLTLARAEIEQDLQAAKQQLRKQVASIAIASAEKILQRQVDAAANNELLDQLIEEI